MFCRNKFLACLIIDGLKIAFNTLYQSHILFPKMSSNKLYRIFSRLLCVIGISLAAISCSKQHSPETLLNDTMVEINGKDSGFDKFRIYNRPGYYAIFYQLDNTPENKAKILWLGSNEKLGNKFRSQLLGKLKEGEILARVVKEEKSLVLGVFVDNMEYRVVIPPAEIVNRVFKTK